MPKLAPGEKMTQVHLLRLLLAIDDRQPMPAGSPDSWNILLALAPSLGNAAYQPPAPTR